MGFDGYFASRARADGRRAGGGRDRHLLQLQPRASCTHAIPAAWDATTPATLLDARLDRRRCRAAARARRRRRRPRDGRGRRAGADRRRGLHRRRAAALRRPRQPAVARRAAPRAVARHHRCSASSAATATSPAWSTPGSTASTRSSCTPHRVRCRVPRSRPRGAGTTRPGRRRSAASAARGLVDDGGAFTEAGAALRQHIEDRTDALALAPWEALGEEGCDELRTPGAAAQQGDRRRAAPSGSGPANYRGVTLRRMAVLRFSYGTMGSGKSTLALQIHHNLSSRGLRGLLCTQLDRDGARVSSRLGVSAAAVDVGPEARPVRAGPRLPGDQRRPRVPRVRRGAVLHTRPGRAAGPRRRRAQRRRPRARAPHRLPGPALRGLGRASSSWPTSARSCRSRRAAGAVPAPRRTPALVNGRQVYDGEVVVVGDTGGDAEVVYELLCRRHWLRGETGPRRAPTPASSSSDATLTD